MSAIDARRARWRADLHEWTAAALRAAGLEGKAAESDAEIAYQRSYAALMDELADAKEAKAADPSPENLAVLKEVKGRVATFRRTAREGSVHPRPGVVNNISEPSDAELIELGY